MRHPSELEVSPEKGISKVFRELPFMRHLGFLGSRTIYDLWHHA